MNGANRQSVELYVRQLRVLYTHAGVAAASLVIMVVVNWATNASADITREWSAWWSLWALIGWSLGLAVHGLVVRLNRPSLASSTWEQQQVDKLLAS